MRGIAWALILLTGIAAAVRMAAQDVTVLPLEWREADDRGDQLPVQKGLVKPEFPAELAKTTQIGWVEVDLYLSKKSELFEREAHGTLPYYEDAVNAVANHITYQPALRAGKAVAARLRQVILFNPASAAANGPDATPRLLRADVIVDPARKVASEALRPQPEVVWVSARVDQEGRVAEVLGPTERLTELILKGTHDWLFAPARRNGVATEAVLRMPVILVAPDGPGLSELTPARVLARAPVNYPDAEEQAGVNGEVMLEFFIDTEGHARDIDVLRTTTAGFARAAEQSISHWKFMPAIRDGKPLATRARQMIVFNITEGGGDEDGSGPGAAVQRRGNPSKLPEQVRYDTPPTVWQLVQPIYPFQLLAKSIKGSAQVAIVVGPDGKVAVSKIMHAEPMEFGYALQAAVEQFIYKPAIKNGDPTQTIVKVGEDFDPKSRDSLIVSDEDRGLLKIEQKHRERIAKLGELDASPKPLDTPAPDYPRSLATAVKGEAVVEFLLNDEGHVFLPRIVSASQPAFGYAAVQGVAKWVFEPPTSKGKPTMVLVRVPITFEPPPGYPDEQRISAP